MSMQSYMPHRRAKTWEEVRARAVKTSGSSAILNGFKAGRIASRTYSAAMVNRLSGDWSAMGTSADSEILPALRILRSRSRSLLRDNDYAKWAVSLIQNNVIGSGIGFQAQVKQVNGALNKKINDQIETCLAEWMLADQCDPAGRLGFADIERMIFRSMIENGEVLVRKVRRPFGKGRIPYALELIEADRLMDQWSVAKAPNGNEIRMGVEIDEWKRPIAYWLHPVHPGDLQFQSFVPSKFIRVPAEDMIHLMVPDRINQTRGVPWMHTAIKRVTHMGGYEEAEVVAARSAAAICGFITSGDMIVPDAQDVGQRGQSQNVLDFEPGTFRHLAPGEAFNGFNPSRPNQAMEPFMRLMLRGMAAGIGVSYASLSKDYSQSNYSSSRLALLDDRDMWRMLQGWFIRNFRQQVHADVLDAAALAGELNIMGYFSDPKKFQAVRFKPRGWSWIDPTKEVQAYKEAVRCGFMTVSDVIDITSEHSDYEDVLMRRKAEIEAEGAAEVVFDTNPSAVDSKGKDQAAPGEVEPSTADENIAA